MTRGEFWRTASVTLFVTVLCLLIGPLVGTLMLFVRSASFAVVNIVSAIVDAALSPLVAITTTYLYFDLRIRAEHAQRETARLSVLPAEA